VLSGLKERYLSLREAEQHKIHALQSDLRSPDLGIPANVFHQLQCLTSLVIHSAWAVNFNLGVKSFEDYYIHGTQNLLNFTLSVRRRKPARFVFCSSISGALGKTMDGPIPEAVVKDLADAQKTGYSQSKLVTEHIVGNARSTAGADVCILRIGQIVGDTQIGLWNPSESIPLMISTAEKIGLPELDEVCCPSLTG
jgi:thioester reductase-like protein